MDIVGDIILGIFDILGSLPPKFLAGVILTLFIIIGVKKLVD